MNFSHFLITQFNLRNFPLSDNDEYEKWIKWTRNRIELFRNFCLPSVLNQTCREFTWLLYFDAETPPEFGSFIDEVKSLPVIEICYYDGAEDFHANYFREVRKRTIRPVKWVITTRVDNDDCLHKEAVRIIQENFTEKHKYLISLASGYILNTDDKTLSHYYYPMSPFISLVENVESDSAGIFEKIHTRWDSLRLFVSKEIWFEYFNRKARRSRFILRRPMWIQTVHGDNISNSFYRGFPVLKSKDLGDFGINIRTNRLPFRIIGRYYNYVVWKRYLKSLIVKTFINK